MPNRVVLVTGAASGIGAAVCRRIAGPETRLVLHTRRNANGLEAVAAEARAAGAEVATLLGDLAAPDLPERLVRAAVEAFGGLDQIVANAGFARRGGIADVEIDDLVQAERAMPDAFFLLCRSAAPRLAESGCGRVVAVSSFVAHAFAAEPLFAATAAAKAAVEALAKTFAVELAGAGVTVNCVAPGFTRKDAAAHAALSEAARAAAVRRVPLGRIGTADDAAALIAFLLSPDAGYITGQTIHVDGGLTLA